MTVFIDDFDRANAASIATGAPVTWEELTGSFDIDTNAAESQGGDQVAFMRHNVGSADMYVKGTFIHRANNDYASYIGLNMTSAHSFHNTFGLALVRGFFGAGLRARATYWFAGTDSALPGQTDLILDAAPSIGETWEVMITSEAIISGASVELRWWINGVEQTAMGSPLTVDEPGVTEVWTGQQLSLRTFDGASASMAWDSVEAGTLADLPGPPIPMLRGVTQSGLRLG